MVTPNLFKESYFSLCTCNIVFDYSPLMCPFS